LLIVSLPREHLQEIKRMMMLTTHGLFLTCTQKLYLYIYTTHHQLVGPEPLVKMIKGNPTYLEGQCFTHGGESPSTLVPCLAATAHPLLSIPPSPPSHPLGPQKNVTMTTSTITVFFIRNMNYFNDFQNTVPLT
jgi:hypothetical protein